MIYSLTGTLVHTEPGAAVVDVGGVAFRCMTSMNTLRGLLPAAHLHQRGGAQGGLGHFEPALP